MLDSIQQMPPYARLLEDLCTTWAISAPKKTFLVSGGSSIILSLNPDEVLDCLTILIVIGD